MTEKTAMSAQIDGVPFTVGFLLEKLRNSKCHVDGNLSLENLKGFKVKKFSAGSAFMSEIIQVKLEWMDSNPLKSVILKVPGYQNPAKMDIDESGIADFVVKAHDKECAFYDVFAAPKVPIRIPAFYYGSSYSPHHKNGIIIMEDLSERSAPVPMLPGFTPAQAEAVVRELARVQAVAWMDRSWIPKLSAEFGDMGEFLGVCWRTGLELKGINPEMFGDLMDQLKPAFDSKYVSNVSYSDSLFGVPATLVHSDLWSANVLFENDENGHSTDRVAAIIDWQMCCPGNPCADLARLLNLNTPVEYRRNQTNRILAVYLESVREVMGDQTPLDFEQLKRLYNASLPLVATYTAFGAPLYHRLASVVGEPADPQKQKELLHRVHAFFEDTVTLIKSSEF